MEPKPSLLKRNKDPIIIVLIVFYIIILGFGVFGELFQIKWILNLPLFRI